MGSGAGVHGRRSRRFAWISRIGLPATAAGCALTIGFLPAAPYAQTVSPVAYAPETPTKEPLATVTPPAAAGPATCSDLPDFLITDCQLKWYGVRVLGAVDMGGGYQTHGAPFDQNFTAGASYFIGKANRSALWSLAPNGLS